MTDYGVWGEAGRCHAYDCTREQALQIAGRCERLLPKKSGPFFVGTADEARAMGCKNHLGEAL